MEQFLVSARKYRPQTFKDVVGQAAITNTLLNAIENNHLASSLLFTGPRGVGKTTCARILARKINQPGYDDPTEDFAFNVFELDAASNNGVDEMRNLIDQVRIPPQIGQFKVYIIDEVHMLSPAAFNAFLKTLEEPPKHAIFILATTEKQKIIPTILSRCQIFDFKRITVQDAKEYLAEVARSQNIQFEDDALHIIAQKADGAMRDALSIFDRVVSFCGNNLTRLAVTENLNVLDYETYINMTDLIVDNKIPEVLLAYNDIINKGFNGHHFIAGLASHFRDLLVAQNPVTISLLEMGEAAQNLYKLQATKVTQDFLLKGVDMANDCDLKFKNSQNQRLLVELTLMQLSSINFDSEKKKSDFIIPPTYYRNNSFSIQETTLKALKNTTQKVSIPIEKIEDVVQISDYTDANGKEQIPRDLSQTDEVFTTKITESNSNDLESNTNNNKHKVSSMSLASIRAKKEFTETFQNTSKESELLSYEPFTQTEMIEQWLEYAKRMEDNGQHIIASLLTLNLPILEENTILHELPNETSKIDFDKEKQEILRYIRGKLKNHSLTIEVKINQAILEKKLYTTQDKYKRLSELNPNLEIMRHLFGLEING